MTKGIVNRNVSFGFVADVAVEGPNIDLMLPYSIVECRQNFLFSSIFCQAMEVIDIAVGDEF